MQKPEVRILSTGSLSDALIKKAASNSVAIDVIEFIRTRSITDDKLGQHLNNLKRKNIVSVFTSRRAVEAVTKWVDRSCKWEVYCIGSSTAAYVEEVFPLAIIKGTAAYGEDLASLIIRNFEQELHFFCGNLRRDVLPTRLAASGIVCHEHIVYETTLHAHRITDHYDGIFFLSPSAVQSFFKINKLPHQTTVFAIGNTTAEAVADHCDNHLVVADSPSREELVHTAINYFQPI